MKKLFQILKASVLLIIAFFVIRYIFHRYINVNCRLIPCKISTSKLDPSNPEYQIMTFGEFDFRIPIEWEDNGSQFEEIGNISGYLENSKIRFYYCYHSAIQVKPTTMPLNKYLYESRFDLMIMGEEIIIKETDSMKEVTYKWPPDFLTSDTLRTGVLTDSVINLYPNYKSDLKERIKPNYYSLTKYHDSVYFVPIKVPQIIVNSDILQFVKDSNSYHIIRPKNKKNGYTSIEINSDNRFYFALFGENLDSITQEILIDAGKSVKFNKSQN
ncbi:MAG: hypothetical protein ABFS35_01470 [Bacteroidota bacterium]